MMEYMGWEYWYFNYWLTHLFYFAAGLIILFAIANNKWEHYKRKMKILKRVEKYSLPIRGGCY